MTWKKIGCAIDFSDASHAAMTHAAELARLTRAELALVHVHFVGELDAPAARVKRELDLARAAAEAECAAWRAEAARRVGGPVDATVIEGDPAVEILSFVQENGIDLLVIAGHHRGERFTLGKVAERAAREAGCAVLVARDRASLRVVRLPSSGS